jgi:hypothetical protein
MGYGRFKQKIPHRPDPISHFRFLHDLARPPQPGPAHGRVYSTISDFLQTIVGASCDSWWLACFELAPEPSPSWPGLTRAIHAAPPQRRVPIAPRMPQEPNKQRFLTSSPFCGRSLRGNTWVAGTSPAMTLRARLAPPQHANFRRPTASAARAHYRALAALAVAEALRPGLSGLA